MSILPPVSEHELAVSLNSNHSLASPLNIPPTPSDADAPQTPMSEVTSPSASLTDNPKPRASMVTLGSRKASSTNGGGDSDEEDVDHTQELANDEEDEKEKTIPKMGSRDRGVSLHESGSSEFSRTRTNSEFGSISGQIIQKIDAHGRLVAHSRAISADKNEKDAIKLYNERLMKWTSMMRHWERYVTTDSKTGLTTAVSDKVKSRARKGIPDAVRAHVYLKLLDVDALKKGRENLFEELNAKKKIGTGPWDEIIRRDLHRTNPDHVMFMNKEGAGQEALFRVLRAYSLFDEEVGYCQGMGFFVSVMLTYVTEDDAFWLLVGLLSRNHLRELYLPNLIGMRRSFFVFQKILQQQMPKLSKHFEKNDFSAPIYAARWFGTLCADFPIEVTLRIWDVLITEGPKVLYQAGLAVIKKCKKELKAATFDEFQAIFREVQRTIEPDELMTEALKITVKSKDIETFGKKFDEIEAKMQ